MDVSEDDSIEILSTQYQPERSIHVEYCAPLQNGHTAAPLVLDSSLRGIRSVDDYERHPLSRGPASYYFQTPRTLSEGGGAGSLSSAGADRPGRKSMPVLSGVTVRSSVPLFRHGDTLLLPLDGLPGGGSGDSGEKEPLSAEEKKRKRITLAVGIIAGLLIVASILLVAVTLNMTSKIDAIVKEQSDNEYARLTSSNGDVYGIAWKNSSSPNLPVVQYPVGRAS